MFHVELVVARLRQLCSTWNVLHVTPSKLETRHRRQSQNVVALGRTSILRNPSAKRMGPLESDSRRLVSFFSSANLIAISRAMHNL